MTETYVSLGSSTSVFFTYFGPVVFIAGSIALYLQRAKIRNPIERYSSLFALALWITACGYFALPMALVSLSIAIFVPFTYFLTRDDPASARKGRIATLIVGSFASALFIVGIGLNIDQRITLTQDSVSAIPIGVRSRHIDWRATFDKVGLQVNATIYPATLFLPGNPWIDWEFSSARQSGKDFYLHSDNVYWGPHGFIGADQLARRISGWAGAQPKYRQWDEAPQ